MSEPALALARAGALRVLILAQDASRRAALAQLVAAAGHDRAVTASDADIVLSATERAGVRYLTIGMTGDEPEPPGLLPDDAGPEQIEAALRAVSAGLIVRSPHAVEAGFRALEDSEGQKLLTPREIEVLQAVGEGLTNKAIARRLGISLHTVKFHVEAIFRKFGVRTRTGAIAKASEWRQAQTLEL
jgi:DNA-binding CsgD family transcriptional regulator